MAIPQIKSSLGELRDPIGTVFYTPCDVFISVIRHAIEKFEKTDSGKERSKNADYIVYCSDDSQVPLKEPCISCRVKLRKVITDEKNGSGMTSANLLKQMEKDIARGFTPLVIIANYGSANIAANDEIWDLVTVSRRYFIFTCSNIFPNFQQENLASP